MIAFRLVVVYYVCRSIRDLVLKYPITPRKGAPIRLNHIILGRRLEKITQVILCLVEGVDVEPQLDFWRQLVWYLVHNTHDEETEAGGVDGRRLISSMGPWDTMSL